MINSKKILVVAAHPDDEVLGCGGSIAKWTNAGHQVFVIFMSEGITSRNKKNNSETEHQLIKLKSISQKSGELLGVRSIEFIGYPDNRMDSIDLLDIVRNVEHHIEKIKPEILVTHHSKDLNIDHRKVHEAVITACRPFPNQIVNTILTFEVPSSTDWQIMDHENVFCPNWYEDITKTINVKKEALKLYDSEMRKWPHSRSIRAVEYLNRWRGSTIGFEAAEAFHMVRTIK